MMHKLEGTALLAAVTTFTSLGFLMVGYDQGLFAGLGTPKEIYQVNTKRN